MQIARKIIILLVLVLPAGSIMSQDAHFAQFYNAPLYTNPSLTGSFDGKYRFIGNHRTQWLSVTKPFVSFAISAEVKLKPKKNKKKYYGLGLMAFRDKAGDAGFGVTQGNLYFSANYALDRDLRNWFSAGINIGYAQKSLDFNALNFDDQYNGNYFDPLLASGEALRIGNFSYPDFGAGIGWTHISRNDNVLNTGIAVQHLNRPKQSWFEDDEIRLEMKYSFNALMIIPVRKDRRIEPSVLLMRQARYSEYLAGADYRFILNDNVFDYASIYIGLMYRYGDAGIVKFGAEYRDMSLGLSYDVNISGLSPASGYRGGFEISFIYLVRNHYRLIERYPSCPVF